MWAERERQKCRSISIQAYFCDTRSPFRVHPLHAQAFNFWNVCSALRSRSPRLLSAPLRFRSAQGLHALIVTEVIDAQDVLSKYSRKQSVMTGLDYYKC